MNSINWFSNGTQTHSLKWAPPGHGMWSAEHTARFLFGNNSLGPFSLMLIMRVVWSLLPSFFKSADANILSHQICAYSSKESVKISGEKIIFSVWRLLASADPNVSFGLIIVFYLDCTLFVSKKKRKEKPKFSWRTRDCLTSRSVLSPKMKQKGMMMWHPVLRTGFVCWVLAVSVTQRTQASL